MKRVLIALIQFYRKHISPLSPPSCRFIPTCSQYAITAIERFGAIKGTGLTIWRLLRCGPWNPGGFDPVPEKKEKKKKKKAINEVTESAVNNEENSIDEHKN